MTTPGTDALRMLADLFSGSAHETWAKEEIVNIIEDAISLGSPDTRPIRPEAQFPSPQESKSE